MKRIALIVVLALYSMGGCDHDGKCSRARRQDTSPVIPAPAAVMLCALGVSIVLAGRRKK